MPCGRRLDAFEAAAKANGPEHTAGNRHHIAHIQVIHPEDVRRFATLGVSANMQALWAAYEPQMTELTIPFLGDERATWQYPFGDLHRAGAHLAMGSDWPVSTPDPLEAIHVAVNRGAVRAGGRRGPRAASRSCPSRRSTSTTALTAYTAGSAWVNHLEETTGTIEVGKAADLAVIDRDIRATPEAIAEEPSSPPTWTAERCTRRDRRAAA